MTTNSIKATKKMKGFVCHSPASTAVCMSQDYRRSVIVPRGPDDHAKAAHCQVGVTNNSTKYIRLGGRLNPAADKGPNSSVMPVKKDKEKTLSGQPTSLAISGNVFQVVVMRVSIHCQGCAGKLKKHLSKMEGVTSFSIDLESKRLTVMGHVSPSGVLESVSKVKKAEFWPC